MPDHAPAPASAVRAWSPPGSRAPSQRRHKKTAPARRGRHTSPIGPTGPYARTVANRVTASPSSRSARTGRPHKISSSSWTPPRTTSPEP